MVWATLDQNINNTRHNVGKDWLIAASKSYCDDFSYKEKFQAEIATSHSDEILWVIPDNYVNNSGKNCYEINEKYEP